VAVLDKWCSGFWMEYVIKAKKQYPLKYLFSHYMLQVLCITIRDGLVLEQFLHMSWEQGVMLGWPWLV
jgi:hypothetical protein